MTAGRRTKGKAQPQLRSRTTRSSKGRLVNSEASSGVQLIEQLRDLGLYAANTLGDGNCLFRALSDQIYGTESRHHELRTKTCDWIEKHRDRYEPFCEDERGLEVHLRCMREHGTYGGHMELSAFAHMTQHNVKVIQPGLVYVIEWSAFASSSTASTIPSKSYEYDEYEDEEGDADAADIPFDIHPNDREKRRIQRERARERNDQVDKKTKAKEKKLKKGRGQLPTPPLTPDEDEEFDTVYVAYHDWEHFSSIRNLRGPHNGIPQVRELAAPSNPQNLNDKRSPSLATSSRSGSSSIDSIQGPEMDEEDKDRTIRAKPVSKAKKVTLKLSNSGSTTPVASTTIIAPAPSVPSDVALPSESHPSPMAIDPTMIPLPTSRSASPFPAPTLSSVSVSLQNTHPLRESFLAEPSHPTDQAKLLGSKLSPKRTFAESEGDDYSDAATSSTGSGPEAVKRSRMERTTASLLPKLARLETPPRDAHSPNALSDLSALSPLTASSAASSDNESDAGSDAEGEVVSSQDGDDDADLEPNLNKAHAIHSGSPIRRQSKRLAAQAGGEKPLTRRQRKALGLPKAQPAQVEGVGSGKIVIPGGRCRRTTGAEEGKEEWKTNGTGRLDVRGFKELKI